MKRILLGLVVAATLAAAALAVAAVTRSYEGTVAGGGAIHFRAEVTNGQFVTVKGLDWRRVPINCQQGKFPFRGGFAGDTFPVDAGTFHAHGKAGGTYVSYAKVVGQFRKHGQRAGGTLRVHGDLDAHHTNCDSGLRRWWAKRVG
jgi:hypothetical protein